MRVLLFILLILFAGCKRDKPQGGSQPDDTAVVMDEELLDTVERRTFRYFWEGAEPNSGLARERIHMDGEYPQNDRDVITTGGGGFGILALVAGIERGYISRQQGLERMERILNFLEKADSFHGAFPHWLDGPTGRVKPFGAKDDGGDLVETAYLFQGLLAVHQYYLDGSAAEREVASRIDALWKRVEWDWYRNGRDVLYWHWSPAFEWEKNFPVRGYNECLILYVLAASSPTHGVPAEVYHSGWAEDGAIVSPHKVEGLPLNLRYQMTQAGPLFWAHYSFLGLDPNGLKDRYADYFEELRNYTLINRAYCVRNPKGYAGYGPDSWGLTASYSISGYAAHAPEERNDHGVISPTAALSSIVYTPAESIEALRHFYAMGGKVWGEYGFYDAFSESEDWFPQRYLAIDQGPVPVMIENYRSGLLWRLFMSHPDVQAGLRRLGFESPHLP
ncbi:MAG: DUF3131 domain-containing protein [Tannerellaceae bacterium]|jgi:hypothetical protein|nr:DUF3131 domain-containing protein [Tannerellaceae bacterium]